MRRNPQKRIGGTGSRWLSTPPPQLFLDNSNTGVNLNVAIQVAQVILAIALTSLMTAIIRYDKTIEIYIPIALPRCEWRYNVLSTGLCGLCRPTLLCVLAVQIGPWVPLSVRLTSQYRPTDRRHCRQRHVGVITKHVHLSPSHQSHNYYSCSPATMATSIDRDACGCADSTGCYATVVKPTEDYARHPSFRPFSFQTLAVKLFLAVNCLIK